MTLKTVYIVCSKDTGVPLCVYTTLEAADADVAEVDDGRCVGSWTVHDGYTIGRLRP